MYVYMNVGMLANMHVYMYACVYVSRLSVCVYVFMYAWIIYVGMYMHVYVFMWE